MVDRCGKFGGLFAVLPLLGNIAVGLILFGFMAFIGQQVIGSIILIVFFLIGLVWSRITHISTTRYCEELRRQKK